MIDAAKMSEQLARFHPENSGLPARCDPWIATSALQKAIRRGDGVIAQRAVNMLATKWPDRLWRRLVVIALEDIGIADVNLVGEVLWASGRSSWQAQNGGAAKVAAYFACRLCSAPKCREACDLLVIADLHPSFADDRSAFADFSDVELSNIIADVDHPLPSRAIAAWYLAGTSRFPAVGLGEVPGRYGALAEVYEALGVPPHVMTAARLGSTRTNEGHAITLPLIWLAANRSDPPDLQIQPLTSLGLIQGWPTEAYDMHTRPGQRALSLFMRRTEEVWSRYAGAMTTGSPQEMVGTVAFRLEGAQVDRRLRHAGTDHLLRDADRAQVAWCGVSPIVVEELMSAMAPQMAELHRCRQIVLGAGR